MRDFWKESISRRAESNVFPFIFPVHGNSGGLRPLQKAVGVDVDLDAGRASGADAGEPVAQYRLEPHLAAGLDEKPAAVAAAQYGERSRGRAEDGDAGQLRRGAREGAGSEIAGFGVGGTDDQRGQPAAGRQPG